jgi:hypothetical protein
VIVPDYEKVNGQFYTFFKKPMARHQRDIAHLMSLIKAVAMLNAYSRMDSDRNVIANDSDTVAAIKLWKSISSSQILGVPPYIEDYYYKYIVPTYLERNKGIPTAERKGVTYTEIGSKYFSVNNCMTNMDALRKNIITTLSTVGMIEPSKDKQSNVFTPLFGVDMT